MLRLLPDLTIVILLEAQVGPLLLEA
jgi:hypothetical protein